MASSVRSPRSTLVLWVAVLSILSAGAVGAQITTAPTACLAIANPSQFAVHLPAGDDGWSTPGGGATTVDLSGFPVAGAFGAGTTIPNPVVSLVGKPLNLADGTGTIAPIDTIVSRLCPAWLNVGSSFTVRLELLALSVRSEAPVVIVDANGTATLWNLEVCDTDLRNNQPNGTMTLFLTSPDGGTFTSSIPVLPKFIFTKADGSGQQVIVDCGAGLCNPVTLSSVGSKWAVEGGPGGFVSPSPKVPAGVGIRGCCTDLASNVVTTRGSSNFAAGYDGSAPGFPATQIVEMHPFTVHPVNPPPPPPCHEDEEPVFHDQAEPFRHAEQDDATVIDAEPVPCRRTGTEVEP